MESEAKMKARRERRIQERREIALAPPVKIVGGTQNLHYFPHTCVLLINIWIWINSVMPT